MTGIPTKRLVIYGLVIVGLVAGLGRRLASDGANDTVAAIERAVAPIRVPDLQVVRELETTQLIGQRDLFRASPKAPSKPVVAVTSAPAPEPARPDPIEIAIEQAKKAMDPVRLIGVVASGEGALAVFQYEGNTLSRVVGDEIVSGFKLERISQGEIRARHERLGLIAILSLGGTRPLQWTRIE